MNRQIYIYFRGSDRDVVSRYRKQFKGRKCRLLATGGKNSVTVRFLDNGEQLCTSLNALRKYANEYPPNWDEIALRRKDEENWTCERCEHVHEPETGYCITVHHLDGDKANCEDWNLAVLCQRCHLHIQAKVFCEQMMLPGFEHSEWFIKHLEGYQESIENRNIKEKRCRTPKKNLCTSKIECNT